MLLRRRGHSRSWAAIGHDVGHPRPTRAHVPVQGPLPPGRCAAPASRRREAATPVDASTRRWTAPSEIGYPVVLKPRTHAGVGTAAWRRRQRRRPSWTCASAVPDRRRSSTPCSRDDPDVALPIVQRYHELGTVDVISVTGCLDRDGEVLALSHSRKVRQSPRRLGVGTMFEPSPRAAVHRRRRRRRPARARVGHLRARGARRPEHRRALGRRPQPAGLRADEPRHRRSATTCRCSGTASVTGDGSRRSGAAAASAATVLARRAQRPTSGSACGFARGPRRAAIADHAVRPGHRADRRGDARVARSAAGHALRPRSPPPPASVRPPVPRRHRGAGRRHRDLGAAVIGSQLALIGAARGTGRTRRQGPHRPARRPPPADAHATSRWRRGGWRSAPTDTCGAAASTSPSWPRRTARRCTSCAATASTPTPPRPIGRRRRRRLLLVQDEPRAGRAAAAPRPRRRRRGHLAVRAVAGAAPRRARRAHHLQRSGQVAGVDPHGDPPRRAAHQRQLGQRGAR